MLSLPNTKFRSKNIQNLMKKVRKSNLLLMMLMVNLSMLRTFSNQILRVRMRCLWCQSQPLMQLRWLRKSLSSSTSRLDSDDQRLKHWGTWRFRQDLVSLLTLRTPLWELWFMKLRVLWTSTKLVFSNQRWLMDRRTSRNSKITSAHLWRNSLRSISREPSSTSLSTVFLRRTWTCEMNFSLEFLRWEQQVFNQTLSK